MSSDKYNWEYENSIHTKDQYVDVEDSSSPKYNPFRTNRSLSNYPDTVLFANEMNMARDLDYKLQYDYLFFSIRKKKRFFQNRKIRRSMEDFDLVQKYYKYSNKKTNDALAVLTDDQLAKIRKKMDKGGIG